jgi:transposase
MSRYRLIPTPAQERMMREHCAHARFVWNLCVEQQTWWRPGRGAVPNWVEQGRQLTEARAEFEWLRNGCYDLQQQAIRDFDRAMKSFFGGTRGKPGWRKAGRNEGFGINGRPGKAWDVRRLSRKVGEVRIPKVGWVRFRWSRAVTECKSYRVTLDPAGRWHVAFTVIPPAIARPGTGEVVGVDRGIAVSAALSTGEMLSAPRLSPGHQRRLLLLQRRASRQFVRGCPASARLMRTRRLSARLRARDGDARKDWVEKVSTDLARRFDVIRVEDLKIAKMTRSARGTVSVPSRNVRQKAGLNREIARSGWGLLVTRLEQKAPGRVEKINPAYTSLTCSACGHVDPKSRESQADFRCTACNFACNADVNAAINIAAGHAVNARRGDQVAGPMKREPQHGDLLVA